jgi:hypothetical protein
MKPVKSTVHLVAIIVQLVVLLLITVKVVEILEKTNLFVIVLMDILKTTN